MKAGGRWQVVGGRWLVAGGWWKIFFLLEEENFYFRYPLPATRYPLPATRYPLLPTCWKCPNLNSPEQGKEKIHDYCEDDNRD